MNKLTELYNDPRHELLSELIRLFESQRAWSGQGWKYHDLRPDRYLPLRDKVMAEIDKLAKEYGLGDK